MNRKIKTKINRTNLIATLFFCALFSFNAIAQEAPLNSGQLQNLIVSLKGVLQENLAVIEKREGKQYKAITQKWEKRTDLSGKTKSVVIELLFSDVKSIVKDSGMQYQIYSIFSFQKQIPIKSSSAQNKANLSKMSKSDLVNKLVDLTLRMHPYVGIDEEVDALLGPRDTTVSEEDVRKKGMKDVFDKALKLNRKLTPQQKSFVRANYDQLIRMVDKITEDAIRTNFPVDQWIKEGLQKSYARKFSAEELSNLINYFQGTDGPKVLRYIRYSKLLKSVPLLLGKAEIAEHQKFSRTLLGKNFFVAYINETIAYEQSREAAARFQNPNADGFWIYREEYLNKLFNKFVADNYGKRKKLNDSKPKDEPQSIFLDEFTYGNREDMMLRIDGFTNNLQADPMAKGYIVSKGDKNSSTKAEKQIKDYLKQRSFDLNRFVFHKVDGDKNAVVQLWLVPKGAKPPVTKESSAKKKEDSTKDKPAAMLFDQFPYVNREDFKARFDAFNVELQNRPGTTAHIVLSGSKKSQEDSKKEIFDYMKLRMVEFERFVIHLGDENSKRGVMEFWIVPAGAEPPVPKQSVKQKDSVETQIIAMVEELKGVVSRITPDKNEAKLVAAKWDARKDLNGKTKSEVIELLFEDVKSVIKDSGTQYQIYSIFSSYKTISDDSPTDKPLETRALAALVKELKGVITQSIFLNEKEANLINEKWNARKNLAGKTKKDVIEILFDDVRSVIKDFDARTQIFTEFSFYEAIPDDSLTEQPKEHVSRMSKSELVDELVTQTKRLSNYYEKREYPMTPEEKKALDIEGREFRIEDYEEALKENNKLTPKQKEFVRGNYDKLLKMEDKINAEAEKTSSEPSLNHLVEESLRKSYTKFSAEELTSLIASFNGIKGQKHLDSIVRFVFAEGWFGDLEKLGFPKDKMAEYKKFVDSELGKKFLTAYFVETEAYFKSRDEAENLKDPDDDKSLDYNQKLNKLINKFVEANYKR